MRLFHLALRQGDKVFPDQRYQARIHRLLGCIDQREAGLAIVPMDEQGHRFGTSFVNEQYVQLAIALVGPVMRAGAIGVGNPCNPQIKGNYGSQSKIAQLSGDPCNGLLARLFQNLKWGDTDHPFTPSSQVYGFGIQKPSAIPRIPP